MPPYRTLAELPPAQVDRYDHHERRAFLEAFNSAWEQYGRDEHRAFAVAHAAAKRAGAEERGEPGGAAERRRGGPPARAARTA